jgi:hypothetical protein
MILPHPESTLSLNIMVLGTDIVKFLKKAKGYTFIDALMEDFFKKDKKRTPDMFLSTLIFLYSLGLLDKKGYKVKLTPRTKTELSQ